MSSYAGCRTPFREIQIRPVSEAGIRTSDSPKVEILLLCLNSPPSSDSFLGFLLSSTQQVLDKWSAQVRNAYILKNISTIILGPGYHSCCGEGEQVSKTLLILYIFTHLLLGQSLNWLFLCKLEQMHFHSLYKN